LAVLSLLLAVFYWKNRDTRIQHPKEAEMTTQKKLYTQVEPYYRNLAAELETAQESISMMYYAFDSGMWAEKIAGILAAKAQAGVRTRLMVDEFGQVLDEVRHSLKNQAMIRALQATGVEVNIFRPRGKRLTKLNRLHCKVCAIDQRTVFLGGSNIGDHYTGWYDSNLRLDGSLGDTFHQVYDYVGQYSDGNTSNIPTVVNLSSLYAGDAQVWLTVPGQRRDIRRALLQLILDADRAIYLRTWYFLPDQEILEALRSQAENGVRVYVLLSHKTRVRPIDLANYIHCHKLAKSGGQVFRYTEKYMHAKVAWNNHGDVLFGSANFERVALKNTFECSVALRDHRLAGVLRRSFDADSNICLLQTPDIFRQRPLPHKALSYACNLASPWM
jgi:cardiolipin synthase